MTKSTTQQRMTMIFNEWIRQYSEDPESYRDLLDENGNPFEDYGSLATAEFIRIADEMDKEGLLPTP